MIGIVLIGHAHIGQEMIRAVEHILGPQPLLAAVDAGPRQHPQSMRDALIRAMRSCDTGDGVLLLTDMFGGTPCNLALEQIALRPGTEIISGYNLPLLIKALTLRTQASDVRTLARQAMAAGKQYLCMPSDLQERSGCSLIDEEDSHA